MRKTSFGNNFMKLMDLVMRKQSIEMQWLTTSDID